MSTSTNLVFVSTTETEKWVKDKNGLKSVSEMNLNARNGFYSWGMSISELYLEYAGIFSRKSPKYDDFARIFQFNRSMDVEIVNNVYYEPFKPESLFTVCLEEKYWGIDLLFDLDIQIGNKSERCVCSLPIFEKRPFGESKKTEWFKYATEQTKHVKKRLGIDKYPKSIEDFNHMVDYLAVFEILATNNLYTKKYVETMDICDQDGLKKLNIPFEEDFKGDFERYVLDSCIFTYQY